MSKKKSNDLALRNAPISQNTQQHLAAASIFEVEDPDSLLNRTSGFLHASVSRAQTAPRVRAIINYNERILREQIRPEPVDTRLRIAFWEEYARSVDTGTPMVTDRIYAGIVAKETFVENILPNDEKLGYILNIPPNYERATQELLLTAMERLRDILELPLVNKKGQVQGAVLAGILKAADMLDKRVHGASLQRIAIHQHNTAGPGGVAPIPQDTLAMDELALLEKQIADVRNRMNKTHATLTHDGNKTLVERASDAEVVDE